MKSLFLHEPTTLRFASQNSLALRSADDDCHHCGSLTGSFERDAWPILLDACLRRPRLFGEMCEMRSWVRLAVKGYQEALCSNRRRFDLTHCIDRGKNPKRSPI